jgi:hypothetical protein
MCSSPRLIAAYHALHRLSMPRHPPCALLRLISISHVVSSPAIGPARSVLIPHTRPSREARTTIHSSIVKEQGGSRRTRQEEVM